MKKLFLLLVSIVCIQTISLAQCNAYLGYSQQGTTVTFYDSSYTTSGAYNYATSFIDFGNGTTQHMSYPNTYTVTYAPGTYSIWLNVVDSVNTSCQDSTFVTITVGNTPASCVAGFSIWPDSANTGIYYGANTSTSTSSSPTYTWMWGDGTTSTNTYPSHTYASSGTYNICLAISSTGGGTVCTDTFCLSQFVARMKGANAIHSITILDPQANGINTIATAKNLSVYPNPSSTELNIAVKGEKIESVKITSINGQIVATEFATNKINTSNLLPNIYFVEVKTANNIYRTKFIKE